MRVMVLVKATPGSEAGQMPSQELIEQMMSYNEQLAEAGIMLAGEGLTPSSQGARVEFSGSERKVVSGPFENPGELVAGFWIWQVESLEGAVDWVKRMPNPHDESSIVEIRPIFEDEDFGEQLTPELREREARLREREARIQRSSAGA